MPEEPIAQTLNINCGNCNGTSLRAEFPLRNGAAVVCKNCKGIEVEPIEIIPPYNHTNNK